jgi:uracil DNA glycosylase
MDYCPFELGPSWQQALEKELEKPYIAQLAAFVELERRSGPLPVYPPAELVDSLVQRKDPLVFVLWGRSAQEKCKALNSIQHPHLVLKAAHPSPFSASQGFFGCAHFSKINDFLVEHYGSSIKWT